MVLYASLAWHWYHPKRAKKQQILLKELTIYCYYVCPSILLLIEVVYLLNAVGGDATAANKAGETAVMLLSQTRYLPSPTSGPNKRSHFVSFQEGARVIPSKNNLIQRL